MRYLETTANATGAADAAARGRTIMIVDVIDMSTTAEALLDAGAVSVYGAAPLGTRVPAVVDPCAIALHVAAEARQRDCKICVFAEPRIGDEAERQRRASEVCRVLGEKGIEVAGIYPNIGAEAGKTAEVAGNIAIILSDTGGVAFDAAWQVHKDKRKIYTGTIARTMQKRGFAPVQAAAKRAIEASLADSDSTGIALVAASANSLEDILAVQEIYRRIVEEGYLQLKG